MSTKTAWYYKPINSEQYSSLLPKDVSFITEQRYITRSGIHSSQGDRQYLNTNSNRSTPLGTPRPKTRSPEEYREWLAGLSRPTYSSSRRYDLPKYGFHYGNSFLSPDGTQYMWNRMDYMKDVYKSLWSRHGGIKTSFTK